MSWTASEVSVHKPSRPSSTVRPGRSAPRPASISTNRACPVSRLISIGCQSVREFGICRGGRPRELGGVAPERRWIPGWVARVEFDLAVRIRFLDDGSDRGAFLDRPLRPGRSARHRGIDHRREEAGLAPERAIDGFNRDSGLACDGGHRDGAYPSARKRMSAAARMARRFWATCSARRVDRYARLGLTTSVIS